MGGESEGVMDWVGRLVHVGSVDSWGESVRTDVGVSRSSLLKSSYIGEIFKRARGLYHMCLIVIWAHAVYVYCDLSHFSTSFELFLS